jgi:UDP-N-acetylmuramoyl-tripeptide--D-alanyl-D-alanine ligase
MFKLSEVIKITQGRPIQKGKARAVKAVSTDSRTLSAESLFICLQGERFDGHEFIKEAVKKKAAAVIVEKEIAKINNAALWLIKVKDTLRALGDLANYQRSKFELPLIAITGSCGKTTTKEMLARILADRFPVLKSQGTENNLIGLPHTLLRLNRRHRFCVVELGTNKKGEIKRLCEIARPNIGIITNIGQAHLEFFRDENGVLEEKSALFKALPSYGLGVINADDPFLERLSRKKWPFKIISVGMDQAADFRAEKVRFFKRSLAFDLRGEHFQLNILGRHNLYNALAAIASANFLGLDLKIIRQALTNFTLPKMRMQYQQLQGVEVINDSYNANPSSVLSALGFFAQYPTSGRRIFVFGDMLELGKKSQRLHRMIGEKVAGSGIDIFVTVGKASHLSAQEAMRKKMPGKFVWRCVSPEQASSVLAHLARRRDAILIKGSRKICMERALACFTTSYIR